MSEFSDSHDIATANAAAELAALTRQIDTMRSVLVRLFQDVAQAEDLLNRHQSVKLLEANEQLIMAALRNQPDAPLQAANEQLVLAALSAQELQAAAENARRQQTEFLAVVAHELRNPLAPIRIAATLLGRIHTDEPLLLRAQAIIERQVAQMSRLINDLLDVASGNIGKLRLEWQAVEVSAAIALAVEAVRPALDARQQCLSVELPPQALKVHGDTQRLVQIFSNLLDNASKYTPHGGTLGLSVVAAGETVLVSVSDNGIGISAQTLLKVFEPFVQDAHAVAFNPVGVGLGLAVVRELVEAHHGRIVASSDGVGQGSRFVVTLPLTR